MSIAAARTGTWITSAAKNIILNPVLTGPLLWLLTKAPVGYRSSFIDILGPLMNTANSTRFVNHLKIAFALGIIRGLNWAFNLWALAKWSTKKTNWVWNEEIAIVTGGCRGIGMLIVDGLVTRGVKVVILDVSDLPARFQSHKQIMYFQCDITKESTVMEVAMNVKDSLGTPTVLVNNAGICGNKTILDTSEEYLHRIFDVNILAHFYTVKAFLPDMLKARKGHIVTIASGAGFITVANMVDYCATKAAALSFHEGLGQELKHRYCVPEVLTTCVHPHWTKTPMLNAFEDSLIATKQFILKPETTADAVVKQIISGKSGQLIIPEAFSLASALRGLPHWLQEGFRDSLGKSVV
ncbi:NAD(P)-binding protein [Pseudovirgaria hyperparasitica]|uniref:Short-chain dehydrogenase/reductase 3 n=1 Tax=Pseudovirgaria hyperparasitica TaxID=470096 RepID=A0A6A6VXP7_9PEZI|nr:NAD(P)-binding protein [Pseudovirgaria hyperparasitica]KAF2754955.1 NAD(P)-binding protein [Pseudovirgaria hyperparasitica]